MKTFFALLLLPLFAYSAEVLTYEETIKGKVVETTDWAVDSKEENILAIGKNKEGTTVLELSPTSSMISAAYRSAIKDFKMSYFRESNRITVTKTVAGNTDKKTYSIGNAPWIQRFEFGFRTFIMSNINSMTFVLVSPKDLALHKLVAKKRGYVFTNVNGKRIKTQKVKITLPGFKSMFWDALLWFDPATGDLLKYTTNQGPGTETFTIELTDKVSKQ